MNTNEKRPHSLATKLHDMTSGIESRGPFFQTEMKTYARRIKITEVPIHYRAASHNVGGKQINDPFRNLLRLLNLRLVGRV